MSDESDPKDENPTDELKKGLGHLWRAARGAATSVKKELDRTDFGRAFEDAGRELTRAATNVVGRISTELNDLSKHPEPPPPSPDAPPEAEAKPPEEDEFDGVKPRDAKPNGPTPADPGFRIMVDDDKKPR